MIKNTSPHRILGDDQDGPHSSAIIVGRKTVIASAHSLGVLTSGTLPPYTYLEDYWIQSHITRDVTGNYTTDDRVPLKLHKFHLENDWAIFVRVDHQLFAESEIATIDTSPLTNPGVFVSYRELAVLHCPVSLASCIVRAGEFRLGCQISYNHLQSHSSHHVKYEGRDLCRGSSGGGVYFNGSSSVLGMHIEAINEADYDNEAPAAKDIPVSDKRVTSEGDPYPEILNGPAPKKMKSDSDTIASLAGGNNGLGSALIICKFPRLMYYIAKLEKEP